MPEPLGTGASSTDASNANGQADSTTGVQQTGQEASTQTGETTNASADKGTAQVGTDAAGANADTAKNQPANKTTEAGEDSGKTSREGKLIQQFGEQRKLLANAALSDNPKQALVQAMRQSPDLAQYFEKRFGTTVDDYEAGDGSVTKNDDNNKLLTILGVPDDETDGKPNKLTQEKTAKAMLNDIARAELTLAAREIGKQYNLTESQGNRLVDLAATIMQTNAFLEPSQAMEAAKISVLGKNPPPKPQVVPPSGAGGGNSGAPADAGLLTVQAYGELSPLDMAIYQKKFGYKYKQ